MYDLLVVGAGPVGSYIASLCGRFMETAVLEEDRRAGNKTCSGLVSPGLMEKLPVKVRRPGLVQHTVRSARIHFMDREFEFRKSKAAAYVLDRDVLDVRMAEHAEGEGAEMKYGERVLKVLVDGACAKVSTGRHTFESKVVAGCDGASSVTAKSFGQNPPEMLNGLILYEKKECVDDYVEMWFDKSLVKDGFFWKIPRGDSTEYGCMGYKLSFPILSKFFGLKSSGMERRAAPIPIGLIKTFADRRILVGDSASQTKPWSGGGLAYGLHAAICACDVLKSANDKADFSEAFLSSYEKAWKEILLRDMQAGLMAREFYRDLDLKGLSIIAENAEMIKKMQRGDMIDFDFPFSSIMGGGGDANDS